MATIRSVTHRYRRATVDTLKVAFASSSVLELVATLSVALVAVTVGLRLASGSVDFRVALTVLLLAPEAYWPLRRVGAEFHAAAEGTAALADADALLARRGLAAARIAAPGTRDARPARPRRRSRHGPDRTPRPRPARARAGGHRGAVRLRQVDPARDAPWRAGAL